MCRRPQATLPSALYPTLLSAHYPAFIYLAGGYFDTLGPILCRFSDAHVPVTTAQYYNSSVLICPLESTVEFTALTQTMTLSFDNGYSWLDTGLSFSILPPLHANYLTPTSVYLGEVTSFFFDIQYTMFSSFTIDANFQLSQIWIYF